MTWGVFDGVHRGHRKILHTLVNRAAENEVPAGVLTFDPHPAEVVGQSAPPSIYSLNTRVEFLKQAGPDVVGVLPFSESFSDQSPSEFYRDVLRGTLNVRGVVLGRGARFGNERSGDLSLLRELGQPDGVEVISCDYAEVDGERVSSSRIRDAIRNGDLEVARRMLGRPVQTSGTVVKGQRRGHEIGFPTANLDLDHDVYPPRGIYGGVVPLGDRIKPAVTSIGIRPTFEGEEREVVEVHLLDFDGDLYGESLTFRFRCFLREEEAYARVDELIEQIKRDVQAYRNHPSYPTNRAGDD